MHRPHVGLFLFQTEAPSDATVFEELLYCVLHCNGHGRLLERSMSLLLLMPVGPPNVTIHREKAAAANSMTSEYLGHMKGGHHTTALFNITFFQFLEKPRNECVCPPHDLRLTLSQAAWLLLGYSGMLRRALYHPTSCITISG